MRHQTYPWLIGAMLICVALMPEHARANKQISNMLVDLGGGVNMELAWIPPGTFVMGSPGSEMGRQEYEGPQHSVTISSGFWMGVYPVTQQQYSQVMGENPSLFQDHGQGTDYLFKDSGPNAPVECVGWEKANEYCLKMQALLPPDLEGMEVRLPTEAEWEYACRAGTTNALYTGQEISLGEGVCTNLDQIAWFKGNSAMQTEPVGQKQPNAWGLYDMLGNVSEWCLDGFREYDEIPRSDPVVPMGNTRAVRGGSFMTYASQVRVARRGKVWWFVISGGIGFRVVIAAKDRSAYQQELDPMEEEYIISPGAPWMWDGKP